MKVYRTLLRTPARERTLLRLHAKGYSDAEIATKIGMVRETVGDWRRAMGLPHNAYSEHRHNQVRKRTREQLRAAELKSLAEVRSKVYRNFAVTRGWPADLRPRQVQILDALYECGPLTREAICDAIGYHRLPNQRKWLLSKYCQGGTYLTDLMHRGLVRRLAGRVVKGAGRGKSLYLYAIPIHIQRGAIQ